MDPENVVKDTVLHVSSWLRGIWEMRRRASPVQQWVDSLPSPIKSGPSTSLPSLEASDDAKDAPIAESAASLPEFALNDELAGDKENRDMTVSTPIAVPSSPAVSFTPSAARLARDPSFQSDSSHCSSVESLLELRRADPEAILLSLGFGGCANSPQDGGPLARIPKRFLQPSKLKGITIDDFVKHQQEASESLDSTSLGYRGLTGCRKSLPQLLLLFFDFLTRGEGSSKGVRARQRQVIQRERDVRAEGPNKTAAEPPTLRTQWLCSPYVAPSEIVQKIMQRLREHESHELDVYLQQNNVNNNNNNNNNNNTINGYGAAEQSYLPQQQDYSRLSVLSPDNRQFLERPRSKSPDMRNKRMIIGQKSFAFGRDNTLIEINQSSQESDDVFEYADVASTERLETTGPSPTTDALTESTTEPKRSLIKSNGDSTETVVPPKPRRNTKSSTSSCSSSSDEEDICTSTKEKKIFKESCDETPRRASEGSNDKRPEQEEGRRHSDSVLQSKKRQGGGASRRKSLLRRQAKIRETNSDERIVPLEEEEEEEDDECGRKRCEQCGRLEVEVYEEDEEDKDSGCCYKRTSESGQSCWREVEKVKQKNKKLEDSVAKSRREISEIRDMLSTVLSVRMEPGF